MVPLTLYGTGIMLSSTCEVSSCLIWLLWSPIPYMDRNHMVPHMFYMTPMVTPYHIWNRYLMPPYLIWKRGHMVLPHVCIVPPHVKCLHVLYDFYGPPQLIWKRYCVVPSHVWYDIFRSPLPYMEQGSYGPSTCTYDLPYVLYDSYGPTYLIWNRYLMVPITLYRTDTVCFHHVHMVPPQVKWLHVLYDSYGSPIPYIEKVLCGPPQVCIVLPTYVTWFCQVSPYLIWNSYLMVPLPYTEQVLYGPPTCEVSSYLIWFSWSPIPYM